jgi:hypothetical protein
MSNEIKKQKVMPIKLCRLKIEGNKTKFVKQWLAGMESFFFEKHAIGVAYTKI